MDDLLFGGGMKPAVRKPKPETTEQPKQPATQPTQPSQPANQQNKSIEISREVQKPKNDVKPKADNKQ
jgi:hypothetical protein